MIDTAGRLSATENRPESAVAVSVVSTASVFHRPWCRGPVTIHRYGHWERAARQREGKPMDGVCGV